jgi:hypothetical protein
MREFTTIGYLRNQSAQARQEKRQPLPEQRTPSARGRDVLALASGYSPLVLETLAFAVCAYGGGKTLHLLPQAMPVNGLTWREFGYRRHLSNSSGIRAVRP